MARFLTIFLMIVGFNSISYASSIDDIIDIVIEDIEGLIGDTVNEGDQTAHVIYKRGRPEAECSISNNKKIPSKKWLFCKVNFKVKYEDQQEVRSCKLLYAVNLSNAKASLERGPEDFFTKCIENLSESI